MSAGRAREATAPCPTEYARRLVRAGVHRAPAGRDRVTPASGAPDRPVREPARRRRRVPDARLAARYLAGCRRRGPHDNRFTRLLLNAPVGRVFDAAGWWSRAFCRGWRLSAPSSASTRGTPSSRACCGASARWASRGGSGRRSSPGRRRRRPRRAVRPRRRPALCRGSRRPRTRYYGRRAVGGGSAAARQSSAPADDPGGLGGVCDVFGDPGSALGPVVARSTRRPGFATSTSPAPGWRCSSDASRSGDPTPVAERRRELTLSYDRGTLRLRIGSPQSGQSVAVSPETRVPQRRHSYSFALCSSHR